MFELTVFYENGTSEVLSGFGLDGVDQAIADIEGDPQVVSIAVKWIEE